MTKSMIALFAGASALSFAVANAGEMKETKAADDITAEIEAVFAAADTDGSGTISRAEHDAYFAQKSAEAAAEGEAWGEDKKAKADADFAAMAGDDDEVSMDEAKAFVMAKYEENAAEANDGAGQ